MEIGTLESTMEAAAKTRGYTAQLRYLIEDDSNVGEARRAAQAMANFEYDAQTAGRVAIVTTELANNLLRHAGGGEILIQTLGTDAASTVEVMAIDRGPGMSDVARCMADGFSTAGTLGTGLGAVRRLAHDFDIHSAVGEGTVVMARFGGGLTTRFGAVCVPMPGEVDCGDAWHLVSDGDDVALIVVDGLGHGTFAAEAAQAGVGAFASSPWVTPQEVMTLAASAMAKTRGGAAACARLRGTTLSYAGIGNISGSLVTHDRSQGLVSHAGTLGMQGSRRAQQFEHARPPGSLLIMHSDGVSARWVLRDKPELLTRHPAIIAAVLYRDHGRNRDDSTVVVVA
jgi:anti-sigma regulatory factor (Ser/Thr protein kinase)